MTSYYIQEKLKEALEDLRDALTTTAGFPGHITELKKLSRGRVFIGFSPKYDYPNVRIEPGDIPSVPRAFRYRPHIIVETLGRGDESQVDTLLTLTAEVLDVVLDSSYRRTAHNWIILEGASVRTGLAPAPGRKGQFLRWSDIELNMQYGGDWYE